MLGGHKVLFMGRPGWAIGADLWKDFVANRGNMGDPTDTHAATIYAPNVAGLYTPFGANVLTRTDLGLQTVPTRTNLALRSQEFNNATWTKAQCSVTADAASAPDGTATADTLTENSTTNLHRISQVITLSASTAYTWSAYVKPNGRTWIKLTGDVVGFATAVSAYFNLSGAGAVGTTGGSPTATTITALANGWYFVTVTATSKVGAGSTTFYLSLASADNTDNYAGDGASGAYVWQFQVEAGTFATPPIVTTSASANVNGNQQVVSGLGTQLATGVGGIIQVDMKDVYASTANRVFAFTDGTTANSLHIQLASSTTLIAQITQSNADQGQVTFTIPTLPTGVVVLAFAFGTDYIMARCVGQAAPTADTLATFPTGLSQLGIGGRGTALDRNSYQFTRKLALKFGVQDANTFADLYRKAQLAAAA